MQPRPQNDSDRITRYTSLAPCFGTKRGQNRMERIYESWADCHTAGAVGGVGGIDLVIFEKLFEIFEKYL